MLVTLALGYSCRVADGEVACLDFPNLGLGDKSLLPK